MIALGLSAGLLLVLLLLVVLVAIPIKIGAHLAGARRTGIAWCALAAVVGVMAGDLTAHLFGGLLGGALAAFLGFIIAIHYLLGTSIAGALGLTIVALLVSLLGLMALTHFSFAPAAPVGGWAI
jgi:energy-converting hydrogenase Eha subunit B